MTLTEALQRLWEQNRAKGIKQRRTKPVVLDTGVPTLAKGQYREPSPQLLERFAFAGTWENAILGQTWLSAKRMREAWRQGTVRKQVDARRRYWQNSILQIEAADRVSLLGMEVDDDETYLVWKSEEEPRVLLYSGHSETWYPDLLHLVTAFLEDNQA
jgi:hypothetical protein